MAGPIRAILFDKDGTLVDYAASWTPVNARAVRLAADGDRDLEARIGAAVGVDAAGRALRPDAIMAAGSAGEIAAAMVSAGARFAPDALGAALDRLFFDAASSMVPVGDLPAVLGRLAARGLVLGVASSDNAAAVDAFAAQFGLSDLLAFTAGWDSGHGAKPGPGQALAFAAAVGCAPEAIAVVGDTAHDMAMARAAGAGLVVGVLTGTGTRESLAPLADAVVATIAEVEGLL